MEQNPNKTKVQYNTKGFFLCFYIKKKVNVSAKKESLSGAILYVIIHLIFPLKRYY